MIKRMVLNKTNTCLFSFLVFARNHKKWLHALINTMYPAGFLPLKTQWDNNKEALLVWIYSTWVNVSGIMHPLDVSPVIRREPKEFAGFSLPLPSGLSHASGNRGPAPAHCSDSLARIWCRDGSPIAIRLLPMPRTFKLPICKLCQLETSTNLPGQNSQLR